MCAATATLIARRCVSRAREDLIHTLHQSHEELPAGQLVFVYCTCVREATSVRVARELENKGIQVAVIKGGLRAWRKQGLPVEPVPEVELAVMPAFG